MSPAYAAANAAAGKERTGACIAAPAATSSPPPSPGLPASEIEAASAAAGAHPRAAHSESANALWAHMAVRMRAWPLPTRWPLRLRPPHSTEACGAPKSAPVPLSTPYTTAEPRGHAALAAASAEARAPGPAPQSGSTSARPCGTPSISTDEAVGSAVIVPVSASAAPAAAPGDSRPAARISAVRSRWPRMNAARGSAPAAAAAGAGASAASTGTARAGPPPAAPPGPCTAVALSGAET